MGLPVPELDNKTFDELVDEARLLIPRFALQWTDHNIHDPGITFIELFAWLAEMQIYQLNKITDNHKRTFLKLVGFTPLATQPAHVDITFNNITDETINQDNDIIFEGEQLVTKVDNDEIVFETIETLVLLPLKILRIRTQYDTKTIDHTEANIKEGIAFDPFGEEAPEGAALIIGFDRPLPKNDIAITFYLSETGLPPVGSFPGKEPRVIPSVRLEWEYLKAGRWLPLDIKKDTTEALTKSGKVVFIGPDQDIRDSEESLYLIRSRIIEGSYEIVPKIDRILLNNIKAVQIDLVEDEDLGKGKGTPDQKVLLKKTPVIHGSLVLEVKKEGGNTQTWSEVDDFEDSGPEDTHYLFDSVNGEITFGNGLNGRIPSGNEQIMAVLYQTTLGSRGNILQNMTFRFTHGHSGITGTNLKEASGGKDPESLDDAIVRVRKDFKTPYRAITKEDYEKLTIATPGLRVHRAEIIPCYNHNYPCIHFADTVTVVAVPVTRGQRRTPEPGAGFLETIENHLNAHRLVTTNIHVIGPEYIEVTVHCTVHLKKRSSEEKVKKRVKEALNKYLDPLNGGPDNKGWPLGRSVYPSEVFQIVDKVEGVNYVTDVVLYSGGQKYTGGKAVPLPGNGLTCSGPHEITAK